MADPGIAPVTDSALIVNDKATIETYQNDYIAVQTQSAADGILVLADNWYPDWKGFLDGQEVPVMRANGAFRGVVLPAGEHKVEFKYISSAQKTGRWLTFGGLLVVALGVVGSFISRRKHENDESEEDHG